MILLVAVLLLPAFAEKHNLAYEKIVNGRIFTADTEAQTIECEDMPSRIPLAEAALP